MELLSTACGKSRDPSDLCQTIQFLRVLRTILLPLIFHHRPLYRVELEEPLVLPSQHLPQLVQISSNFGRLGWDVDAAVFEGGFDVQFLHKVVARGFGGLALGLGVLAGAVLREHGSDLRVCADLNGPLSRSIQRPSW